MNMINKLKKYHRDFEYADYCNAFYKFIDIYNDDKYLVETNIQYIRHTLFRESFEIPVDFITYENLLKNLYKFAGWHFMYKTCENWND